MTLSINSGFFKNQKPSFSFMVAVLVVTLIVVAILNKNEVLLTANSLFIMAIFFCIALLVFFLKSHEQPNGFSVPTISDYPTIQEPLPLPAIPLGWSIRLIKEIEWKKFEQLCLGYFLMKGVNAKLISIDVRGHIELRLDNAYEVNGLVQYKTSIKDIGVKQIKELLALMAQKKVSKGFYIAAGSFSDEAKAFAKENKVTVISGGMLLTMLKRLQDDQQVKLLNTATEGAYKTPTCPSCGIKMISRHGPHQNKYYWGCVNHPVCRQIMPRKAQRRLPRASK